MEELELSYLLKKRVSFMIFRLKEDLIPLSLLNQGGGTFGIMQIFDISIIRRKNSANNP